MTKKENLLQDIQSLLTQLRAGLTQDEDSNGWSKESKAAAVYFDKLIASLRADSVLPSLGIVRGLDHWGVTGGDLLEEIARITNRLREME